MTKYQRRARYSNGRMSERARWLSVRRELIRAARVVEDHMIERGDIDPGDRAVSVREERRDTAVRGNDNGNAE